MYSGDMPCAIYPNPDAIVYPDRIPYRGPIPGGLHDGKLVEIKGHVPYGADVFQINLLTGLDTYSDTAFHMSVRFHGRTVVRNAMQQNVWGPEERHGLFPFSTGQDFTVLILADPTGYRVAVNSQHCFEFSHRLPLTRVSSIFIDGSVQIERIEFVDKMSPYSRPEICNPSIPVYPGVPGATFFPGVQPGVCIPSSGGMQPGVCIPPTVGIQPGVCIPPHGGMNPSYPMPSQVIAPPESVVIPSAGITSSLSPIFNPPIPYAYPIYGGLRPGMMIYISGRPSASAYKFTINLQSGTSPYPPPDMAFHFDARFFNATVVRNTRTNNVWGQEDVTVHHFPFQHAVNFDMIIRIEHERYMVAINGQHFCEMRHRLQPLSRFDTLYIENDIIVSSIRFS